MSEFELAEEIQHDLQAKGANTQRSFKTVKRCHGVSFNAQEVWCIVNVSVQNTISTALISMTVRMTLYFEAGSFHVGTQICTQVMTLKISNEGL